MHIYILPQCSTTAASVLNSAGMDAQFERSCCAISRGILSPMTIFKDKRTRLLVVRSPCWYTVNTNKTTKEICTICDLVKLRKLFGKRSVRTVTYTFDFFIRQWLKEFIAILNWLGSRYSSC